MKWLRQEVCDDLLFLTSLLCFGLIYLHGSPQLAANLPWDGDSYAVPIVNFLDGYRFGSEMHGQLCQSIHPPGMGLILLPSYLLFGHFIGNGVYSIQFAALATIILLYFIGKIYGGRLLGTFAALFFASLQSVRIYSTVIMSEMPTCFILTAMFALLLFLRKREHTLVYILLGALLGLAIAVRIESVLLILPTALVLCYGGITHSAKRIGMLLLGLFPWLLMLAAYNQHFLGSWKRSPIQYWHGDDVSLFSTRNLTAQGYWTSDWAGKFSKADASKMDGNLVAYAKAILSEADGTLPFGPVYITHRSNRVHQVLVVLRTLLGCLALLICLRRFRTDSNLRLLFVWFGTALVSLFVFLVFFNQQYERYFLRFAPFFALLDAMGLVWLIRRTNEVHQRVLLTAMGAGFIAVLAWYGISDKVYHGDPVFPTYSELKKADSVMESNAVVVSNFVGFRVSFFLIRGTKRIQMPLGVGHAIPIWPDLKSPDAFPPACKDPSKVLELYSEGRPIYVIIDRFWGSPITQDDEDNFSKCFDLEPLSSVLTPEGILPCFYRAKPKIPPVAPSST